VWKSKLYDLYINKKYSISRIAIEYNISVGAVYNEMLKQKIESRSSSEAALIRTGSKLDYNISYLNEKIIEWVDGFLLGDGSINVNKHVGRFTCSTKQLEFCQYLMSGLSIYDPSEPKFYKYKYKTLNGNEGCWQSSSRFHPDIFDQYKRWYPGGIKLIPTDIRITPVSMMLFYLGDGTLVKSKNNSIALRLSSDCFKRDNIENTLINKMLQLGIECKINNEGRINIQSNGIKNWFNFIGCKSPISCFDYKFDLPTWRFTSMRASQVASMLSVNLSRLHYLIKIGKVPCIRASKNGRPRLEENSINICKKLIQQGEL